MIQGNHFIVDYLSKFDDRPRIMNRVVASHIIDFECKADPFSSRLTSVHVTHRRYVT